MKRFTVVHDHKPVFKLEAYPTNSVGGIKRLASKHLIDIGRDISNRYITIHPDAKTEMIVKDEIRLEKIWNRLTDPYISFKRNDNNKEENEKKYTREQLYLIALQLDYPDILNFCITHKMAQEKICDNNYFWLHKLRQDYGLDPDKAIDATRARDYYQFSYRYGISGESLSTLIERGDFDIAKRIMSQTDIDINSNNNEVLRWASFNGYLDIVRNLVERGADVNIGSPLRWASKGGHLDIVKYLVERGANIHEIALEEAINGHLLVVKYLVQMGADIHALDDVTIRMVKRLGHVDIYNYLIDRM